MAPPAPGPPSSPSSSKKRKAIHDDASVDVASSPGSSKKKVVSAAAAAAAAASGIVAPSSSAPSAATAAAASATTAAKKKSKSNSPGSPSRTTRATAGSASASANTATAGTAGATTASTSAAATNNNNDSSSSSSVDWKKQVHYEEMTLKDVQTRLRDLCLLVPTIPDGGFAIAPGDGDGDGSNAKNFDELLPVLATRQESPVHVTTECTSTTSTTTGGTGTTPSHNNQKQSHKYDKNRIRNWAASLQSVMEEFNLLVACIPPATYVWGGDRSGAADQFLGNLSNELVRSQEQLLSRVAPRLNDVLAPVVTLVTDKTITVKKKRTKNNSASASASAAASASTTPDDNGGEEQEIKQNYFKTTYEDPDYVDLCYTILARNSPLLRQVVLANFDKLLKAINDYLEALNKDHSHTHTRGGYVY